MLKRNSKIILILSFIAIIFFVSYDSIAVKALEEDEEIKEVFYDISNASITLSNTSYVYDGKAKKPTVTVKLDNKELVLDTDYSLAYTNNTNAGAATVTVTGKGDYTGTVKKDFKITKGTLKVTAKAYKGSYDTKSHSITLSGTYDNSTIKYRTSTKDSWSTKKPTRKKAGMTTVYYQIKDSNCSNTVSGSKTITISKKKLSSLSYKSIDNQSYTGKNIKPSVTIKNGSTKLTKNTDYTLSYKNNKKIGKATVTIKGKGNYTGSVKKSFSIVPKKVSFSSLTNGYNKATLKYKKVSNSSGYQIAYRKEGDKWQYVKTSSLSKTLTELSGNKTYQFKVRAYKKVSGKTYYGAYSKTKSCKIKSSTVSLSNLKKLDVAQSTNKIITVSVTSTSSSSAKFQYFEKDNGTWKQVISTSASIGKKGIGKTKEGDKKTPTGLYHFSKLLGIADDPKTLMDYTKVTKSMYWCGSKKYYNQFIDESKQSHNCNKKYDEHLINYTSAYQYIAVIDYNKKNTYNKGSAIFLHCKTGSSTSGCVAIDKTSMKKMMKVIDEDTVIIIDKVSNITSKNY